MKKKIIILYILFIIQLSSFGQNENKQKCMPLNRVELFGTYEAFGSGIGFIAKGKTQIKNTKHFESYTGIAYQKNHQNETDKLLTGIKGHNSDFGVYLVFDMLIYPFKTKKIFTGIEPYIGITTLKSNGTLDIPEYNISENYSNSYTYLNYGITQTLGYNFGRISSSFFSMLSLKGFIDDGRTRPGDSDSKIFLGINLSYQIYSMP